MSGATFFVLGGNDHATSPVNACLDARPRTADAVRTTAPPDADDVRALVLLGAGDDPAGTTELVQALGARHTPVLAAGHGATVLCAALSDRPPAEPGPGPGRLVRLWRTAAADPTAEPTFGDLVDGSEWLVVDAAGTEVPDDATILVVDDGDAPMAFTPWPGCVATWARLDVPARDAMALLEDAGEAVVGAPFRDGWATALVGRWIDGVVGRTEEEAPWGRRGPPPMANAELFLGARQQSGWSTPAR